MKLLEKLESISLPRIKKLEKGNAASLKEFWDQLIAQYLPRKEIVLAWHDLLMKYIKTDHPTFAIRGYNNAPSKDQYHELRRGFLSKADDFSFFYTDNYHAAYYQKMVLDGYVPTLNEFTEAFEQRKFPSRFGRITQEETVMLAIKKGHDPKINASGFKLAHIIPVGKEYSFKNKTIGNKVILDQYFPKGERSDWRLKHDINGNFYERDIHLKPDAKRYAIAHFLRFVHPFNYFLCPKTNRETNNKCKEIAEYQPLLDLAHNYMLDTYGNAYLEYLSYIMVDDRYYQKTQRIDLDLDIRYGSDIIHTDRIKACLEAIKEAEDIKKRIIASLSEK